MSITPNTKQPQTLEKLKEILIYDPVQGQLKFKKNSKVCVPDMEGFVTIYSSDFKPASKKYKLDKLIWYFIHGTQLGKDERILHRNLDKNDNSLTNLALVSRIEYLEITNAYRNLEGGIRFVQHPMDQYCFRVYWYEGSSERSKVVQDVVTAKRLELKLRFKYMKIITKYCLFDE